jgi:putative inorganic carbon (hco3(-)) transporter
MRLLAFWLTLLATLPLGFVMPFIGLMVWAWLSFMSPHTLIFGGGVPYVLAAAAVTATGWLISGEPKRVPANPTPYLLLILLLWMLVSTEFALDPQSAWPGFSRQWKMIALAMGVLLLANNRVRLHAFIGLVVLSIGYFALKGGLFTVLRGGAGRVLGPEGTEIADNNKLGVAMIMIWPLTYYLRQHSADRLVRWALTGLMVVTVFAVLGTWSRGAFIGAAVVLAYFWWKARRKLLLGACGAIVLGAAALVMPQQWYDRMNSVQNYDEDGSAMGRIQQWGFAIRIAEDHPLVGGGFDASQQARVIVRVYPGERVLAYHSIWFQALGDLGFPGLALFVLIALNALYQVRAVRRAARSRPEFAWAEDLAVMMQVSFVGYMAAASFLSMAYYDVYYSLVACASVLYQLVVKGAPAVVPQTLRPIGLPLDAGSANPARLV